MKIIKPKWGTIGIFLLILAASSAILPGCKSSTGPDPMTGSIRVTSVPTGARVFLDGVDKAVMTDTTLTKVATGNHTIKLVKDGYADYQGMTNVTAGQTANVGASLMGNTIAIMSPNASTVWTKGASADITWQIAALKAAGQVRTQDIAKVKIDLYSGTTLMSPPIVAEATNSGTYSWMVRSDLAAGSAYRVRVSCSTDGTIYKDSVDFSIVEAGGLAVSPASGLASAGPVGGPFTPSSQAYVLQNTGGAALDWTAAKTQTWLNLSQTSGTLNAGATTTITAAIDPTAANALAAGVHADTVTFTNVTSGAGNTTRAADLTVTTPPALSIAPLIRDLTSAAGTTTFAVANTGSGTMNWTAAVTAGGTWLSISSGSSGTNAGVITAAVTANNGAARTGTIQVTAPGVAGSPLDLTVTQTGTAGLAVLPVTGLTSTGTVGGPFAPASMDFTIQNTGGAALDWTAAATQSWVTLSAASGTLNAGASTTVTVSINAAANALVAAAYSDTVTFTNVTNGIGNATRPVSLTVSSASTTKTVVIQYDRVPPIPYPDGQDFPSLTLIYDSGVVIGRGLAKIANDSFSTPVTIQTEKRIRIFVDDTKMFNGTTYRVCRTITIDGQLLDVGTTLYGEAAFIYGNDGIVRKVL